jgi:hypothetical protein
VQLEGLSKWKKIHLIGTRTRDLPACSIVPQPTMLPRAPIIIIIIIIISIIKAALADVTKQTPFIIS